MPRARHRTPVAAPVALALLGVLAVAVAVALTPAVASRLGDPGPAVRLADPSLRAIADLSAAVAVGTLVLAVFALPEAPPGPARPVVVARRLALVSGAVWTLAVVGQIVTRYAVAAGTPPTTPGFGEGLRFFVSSFELGQYLLAAALLAALATTIVAAATGVRGLAAAAVVAVAALVPPALAAHSGDAQDHETATSALGLHLLGISLWVGGLVAIAVLGASAGSARMALVRRYSSIALVAAALVVLSGTVTASTRMDAWQQVVTTRYGLLVLLKATLSVLLLAAGHAHRRWAIGRLGAGRDRAFRTLVVGEAVVMSVVIGVASALSVSVPPVSRSAPPTVWSPAEVLVGYPLPQPPTAARWLTSWQPDILWLAIVVACAIGYGLGVARLAGRGDRWPVSRTVWFALGLLILVWVSSGGPAVYGRWSFSGHMVQHMVLAMLAPIPLVLGAPILLALRALRSRTDGSLGPREWLLGVVHSRWSAVVTHPVVAAAIFTVGLVAFYYSPLFEAALRTHLGHELMMVHFLAGGYLFAWVLVGVDPGARRAPYPLRLLLLFATMAFHAFFGVALLQGTDLLAADFMTTVADARPWGAGALPDQQAGAALAWGLGEAPMLALALLIAVQWSRADSREARRLDRKADRDGDAEHEAYNDYLARLAATASRDAVSGAAGTMRE